LFIVKGQNRDNSSDLLHKMKVVTFRELHYSKQ